MVREQPFAIDSVPVVLLMPLHEIKSLTLHALTTLKLHELEYEEGHVDI
jgi:hypothetical protein